VAPVLLRRCVQCPSGPEGSRKLDLTTRRSLLAGGKSGAAVVPGIADGSYLIERVAQGEMPPVKHGRRRRRGSTRRTTAASSPPKHNAALRKDQLDKLARRMLSA
jgi:hypothetical protein